MSDEEWNKHICYYFEQRPHGVFEEGGEQLEGSLDIWAIIKHAFHQYDALADAIAMAHGVLSYIPLATSNSNNSNLGPNEGGDNGPEYSVENEEQCFEIEQGSLHVPPSPTFCSNNNDHMIYGVNEDAVLEDDLPSMKDDPIVEKVCPMLAEFDMLEDEASMLLFSSAQLTLLGATFTLLKLC